MEIGKIEEISSKKGFLNDTKEIENFNLGWR